MQGPEAPTPPSLFARVGRVLERYRLPIQLAVDLLAWGIGLYLAMVLRFESFTPAGWNRFDLGGLVAIGQGTEQQHVGPRTGQFGRGT